MTQAPIITCLFLDIGGVLLTDGWDHHARQRAVTHFHLDWIEMEERHSLLFATYEEGNLTLEDYLARVIFYQERAFTRTQFRNFMFAQSKPYPEMIDMITRLKVRHGLKIVAGQQRSARTECASDRNIQVGRVSGFLHFLMLRPYPQARC